MYSTIDEVLKFTEEQDVRFIRLSFCDIFGTLKNIAIMSHELSRAFSSGISFDASAVKGFLNVEESDLFLYPDPGTISLLPWRPQQGRVVRLFCDIRRPDGTIFEGDSRQILKNAVDKAEKMGYTCKIGAECEFYLFRTDEAGNPTSIPQDNAGYFDVAPLDKGENVRREICLALEEMGITPESSHHEQGPGQNEVDFKYKDAMTAADNLITFKSAVMAIAQRNGLYASFMPKPINGKSGSGLHVNISLCKDGENIFGSSDDESTQIQSDFMVGILRRAREITAFLNPVVSSYKRFGEFEAPKYITWSRQNRSQLVRIPAATAEFARMELRSPDPMCNPYIAFALIIQAGLEGIEDVLLPVTPSDFNLYTADETMLKGIPKLPDNLGEAVECASGSEFVLKVLPDSTAQNYLRAKKAEWELFLKAGKIKNMENEFLNL